MRGSKHPLRTGARWLLDTMIYDDAESQEKEEAKKQTEAEKHQEVVEKRMKKI